LIEYDKAAFKKRGLQTALWVAIIETIVGVVEHGIVITLYDGHVFVECATNTIEQFWNLLKRA
jgi:hypothetical protein